MGLLNIIKESSRSTQVPCMVDKQVGILRKKQEVTTTDGNKNNHKRGSLKIPSGAAPVLLALVISSLFLARANATSDLSYSCASGCTVTESDPDGGSSVNKTALFSASGGIGTVGSTAINLRATITAQTGSGVHSFGTFYNAPSITSNLSGDNVTLRWDILDASDNSTPVTATDVYVGFADIDGPNNETVSFDCSDASLVELSLDQATDLTWSQSGNIITFAGQNNYSGGAESIVAGRWANVSSFTMQRSANSGYILAADGDRSFNFTNIVRYDCGDFFKDFGDAPSSYGEATHENPPNKPQALYLGVNAPDTEDTTPLGGDAGVGADGDDGNGINDDEDGVAIIPLIHDKITDYSIDVSCTGTGTVSAWIDFNGDGVFNAGERNSNFPVSCSSQTTLTWTGISGLVAGDTYLRVRTASIETEVTNPTGNAVDGEVEDYALTIRGQDYGDAPNDLTTLDAALSNIYNVLIADNAAVHVVDPAIRMGASVDIEADGQPSVNADAEGADDDGVTFATAPDGKSILYMNEANDITVNVSTGGVLSVWIDWNEDGDWNDTGEQVANDQVVVAGDNTVTVTTTDFIPQGSKYARFRFCTTAGQCNTPGGSANDGEVEDYKIDYLAYRDSGTQCNALVNSGFELPPSAPLQNDENIIPGWATVPDLPNSGNSFAERNSIELWADGFLGVPSQEGVQFAEINAYVNGTLYQDVALTPGTTIEWSLWHRGREGTDSMNVLMGSPDEVISLAASSVQATMVTGNTAWKFYSGTYIIPAGQYVTRFGFHSVSTFNGNQSAGNLVDNISLGITCRDYGDAPSQYPTTNSNNGAYHKLTDTPAIFIGNLVDKELDGSPTVAADGDDNTSTDDEDGVSTLPTLSSDATSYSVDVNVTNNTGNDGYLVGWVDFNGNGLFDAAEAATVAVPDGSSNTTVTLNWTGLSGLQAGGSYLRLRLSTDTQVVTGDAATSLPDGVASDGEIEDYALTINQALTPFSCDGTPYTVIDDPSVVQSMDKQTLAVTSLGNLNPPVYVNGIGYNAMDNLIYGFYRGDGTAGNTGIAVGSIVRYGSGRYIEDLGFPSGSGSFDPLGYIGAMDNSGKLFGINSSTLFIVDIGNKPAAGTLTYTAVARSGDTRSPADITFSVYDNALYGVKDNVLVRITQTGVGSLVSTTGDTLPANAGGAWSAADGSLYFYNNSGGELFKVDVSQSPAVVNKVGNVTANGKFDAAACTPPSLLKDASVSETQAGNTFSYTYTIANAFNFPITVDFNDVLPATLTYDLDSLSDNSPGGGSLTTFNDTTLAINGINLSANSQVSFTVAVKVSTAINSEQDIDNQANLTYGSVSLKSDDPDTPAIEDPTRVHVLPTDYGDALDSYGDAGHGVPASPTVYLGLVQPDIETDSQNAANGGTDGTGDDSSGSDDEDGIASFPKLTDIDNQYALDVVVTNTSGKTANLVGWIDFNGDQSFAADEAATVAVATGTSGSTVTLSWSIPATIKAGDVYARIRLTTDTSIATGTANTSVATGIATDGEVEDYPLTIEVGGFPVRGRVYQDSNVNAANDSGEAGISNLPLVLLDVVNSTCVSTRTDADGNYTFFPVIPGDYQIYEASRETVPVPQNCDTATAKDPAGYRSTTANVLPQFSVVAAEVTGKDFGDVAGPTFAPDHSGTALPGNVVFYAHTFTAKSTGTVNFSITNAGGSSAGWGSVVYQDTDCNGKLDGAEASAPLASSLATIAGQEICLINKVYAPAAVVAGETFSNAITASFDFNGNSLAGSATLIVTDVTRSAANDVLTGGSSRLELTKTVKNITQGSAETETRNQANPGDVLEYRLYYTNTGTGPITDLKVNDTVPAFTVLQASSASCDSIPQGMTCAPVVNGDALEWLFTGSLKGGAKGQVSYQVTIE